MWYNIEVNQPSSQTFTYNETSIYIPAVSSSPRRRTLRISHDSYNLPQSYLLLDCNLWPLRLRVRDSPSDGEVQLSEVRTWGKLWRAWHDGGSKDHPSKRLSAYQVSGEQALWISVLGVHRDHGPSYHLAVHPRTSVLPAPPLTPPRSVPNCETRCWQRQRVFYWLIFRCDYGIMYSYRSTDHVQNIQERRIGDCLGHNPLLHHFVSSRILSSSKILSKESKARHCSGDNLRV